MLRRLADSSILSAIDAIDDYDAKRACEVVLFVFCTNGNSYSRTRSVDASLLGVI